MNTGERLLTADYLLLTTHYSLLITHYSLQLRINYYSRMTTCCLLFATYYSLRTTYCLPLTAHFSLLIPYCSPLTTPPLTTPPLITCSTPRHPGVQELIECLSRCPSASTTRRWLLRAVAPPQPPTIRQPLTEMARFSGVPAYYYKYLITCLLLLLQVLDHLPTTTTTTST